MSKTIIYVHSEPHIPYSAPDVFGSGYDMWVVSMNVCVLVLTVLLLLHSQQRMKQDPCSIDLRLYFCMRFRCIAVCNVVPVAHQKWRRNLNCWGRTVSEILPLLSYTWFFNINLGNSFTRISFSFYWNAGAEWIVSRSLYFMWQIYNIVECHCFVTCIWFSCRRQHFIKMSKLLLW